MLIKLKVIFTTIGYFTSVYYDCLGLLDSFSFLIAKFGRIIKVLDKYAFKKKN